MPPKEAGRSGHEKLAFLENLGDISEPTHDLVDVRHHVGQVGHRTPAIRARISFRSCAIISSIIASNEIVGLHPRTSSAFRASPYRVSRSFLRFRLSVTITFSPTTARFPIIRNASSTNS